jgi:hypothetical protein
VKRKTFAVILPFVKAIALNMGWGGLFPPTHQISEHYNNSIVNKNWSPATNQKTGSN